MNREWIDEKLTSFSLSTSITQLIIRIQISKIETHNLNVLPSHEPHL
jgi:hypothetical protein